MAAVREAGKKPVPGLVEQAIEQQRQRRQAEAAATDRRAAAAVQLDPVAIARGRELLPETLRARVGVAA